MVLNKSLIIVGASGVGKNTVINWLRSKHPGMFDAVKSFTTRKIRPGEVDGVNYYYVSQQEFQKRIPEMLEHNFVFGNMYGKSQENLQAILNAGRIPLMDIDIQGMVEIKSKIACEVLCVMPPSWKLLQTRLSCRKTQSKQQLRQRMRENEEQVRKMLTLQGQANISFATNYQYQLTVYGLECWLFHKFPTFRRLYTPPFLKNHKSTELD